jgi:hypothetical protein
MSNKDERNIITDAVADAKRLRTAAIDAAKTELVESMSPMLRALVEKNLKGALSQNEDADRIRRGVQDNYPGESHTGFEEAKEKGEPKMGAENEKELDLESIGSFFGGVAEADDDAEGKEKVDETDIPQLGEAADEEEVTEGKDKKDDEEVDEGIEISESELRKVYEASLKTEVTVTKGFGDMTAAGEIEDVIKDADKGLADVKKGEHQWEKETPPAKQDFTVKEMIQRGMAENKALVAKNAKLTEMVKQLASKIHDVNLFNSKVLHVNRLMNKHARLTSEQKKVVLESIDKAKSIQQVKVVYEAIDNSIKAAAPKLSESVTRKPAANAQKARSSGSADQKVLRESVDRNEGTAQFGRLQQLAGLVNK